MGYLELLRDNPRYRRLWFAEVTSFLGDWFNSIALFTAVERLSGSTQVVAAVFVAKLLPVFAMAPVAGPLIDRLDRRKLLVATDLARAVCAGGLVLAWRLESLHLLIALLVVMMCFAGVFIPAKTAVVPQVTTPRQLNAANALSSASWSTMLALGAALGGVVTGVIGIEVALICDGLTFLVSAAFLVGLPPLQATESSGPGRAGWAGGFVDGLRYLRGRPYLTTVILIKPLMFLGGGATVMLPLFATRAFAATTGATYMGLLYSARGVGALLGSLVVRRLFGDAPRTMRRLILPAFVVMGLAHAGLSSARNIWQAALAFLVAAIGNGVIWVFSSTLGQRAAANEYRGRVFSVEWAVMTLLLSAVAWLAGWVVDHRGWTIGDVALGSGLVLVIPVALWAALLVYLQFGLARWQQRRRALGGDASALGELQRQEVRWRRRWMGEEGLDS